VWRRQRMTVEEALVIIKAYKQKLENSCSNQLDEDIKAFNLAIKALEDATPIESIITKGGMTLSLKKPDIEISDLARCIASALKDITVEEFANKYNILTVTDNDSGKSVSYCRVDNGEEEEV
jgi:hypothetical protein